MANSFEKSYPNITHWVNSGGWIEIGNEDYNGPFVSAYDEGGTVWEGKVKYKSIDEALQDLEKNLGEWIDEHE